MLQPPPTSRYTNSISLLAGRRAWRRLVVASVCALICRLWLWWCVALLLRRRVGWSAAVLLLRSAILLLRRILLDGIVLLLRIVGLVARNPARAVHWCSALSTTTASDAANAEQEEEKGEEDDAENDPAAPRRKGAVPTPVVAEGVVVAVSVHHGGAFDGSCWW